MSVALERAGSTRYRAARPVLSFARAKELAARFGTPLLVLSRSVVTGNYRQLCRALPEVEFFYAAKANPHHRILTTLREMGCSIDVCSPSEMELALRAGFPTERMIHTHPCKTTTNLSCCYAGGIRWFTFDSESEIDKLAEHAPRAKLLLRLAVSSQSSVIDLSAKFGASLPHALFLLKIARSAGLDVRGVSFHVGSQCLRPEDYRIALRDARRVYDEAVARGCAMEVLDIGGGIPVPYRTSVLCLDEYARAVHESIEDAFGDVDVRVIAEPGRCLCADAVTLVTSVIGKSVRKGLPWYIIDDGLYGSFSGKVYDHADYPLLPQRGALRRSGPCVVAGPSCDSSDLVAVDQRLPELDVGELLLVPSMGAYTSASASHFNGMELTRLVEID